MAQKYYLTESPPVIEIKVCGPRFLSKDEFNKAATAIDDTLKDTAFKNIDIHSSFHDMPSCKEQFYAHMNITLIQQDDNEEKWPHHQLINNVKDALSDTEFAQIYIQTSAQSRVPSPYKTHPVKQIFFP